MHVHNDILQERLFFFINLFTHSNESITHVKCYDSFPRKYVAVVDIYI